MNEFQGWFSEAEFLQQRLETVHRERVAAVIDGRSPFAIGNEGSLVVHLIPEGAVRSPQSFAASDLKRCGQHFSSIRHWNGSPRFNVDGFAVVDDRHGQVSSYVQLCRDGQVHGVMSHVTFKHERNDALFLRETTCEVAVIGFVDSFKQLCETMGVKPPFWLFVSLAGCKGAHICKNNWGDSEPPIDRDVVHLPALAIPSLEFDPRIVLRPVFDTLWNAAGYERSLSYDQSGNRTERDRWH